MFQRVASTRLGRTNPITKHMKTQRDVHYKINAESQRLYSQLPFKVSLKHIWMMFVKWI